MDETNYTKNKLLTEQSDYSKAKVILITALLSIVLFISMTGQGIVIPVFPLYVETFGGGSFQLGLLIAVFSLTSLLLSPLIGSWADHYGRKLFIILGLLGFAIANLLYTTSQSFDQLLFYRIIEGSTAAGTGAIVNALLIDIIPSTRRAQYLGIANGSGFVGVFVGPFIGGFLVQNGDIALPFEVSALVAFIGMIFAIFILPNDYSKFRNRHNLKKMRHVNFKNRVNFTNWLVPGATVVFCIVIVIRFCGLMAWTLIQPVVPIYLYGLNYTSLEVGIFFSCYGLTMFIGQIVLGGLSDRFGRKPILQLGLIIYFTGYLSLINTTNIINFYIAGALNGIGLSLIVPSIVALLADLTNNIAHRGKVMAIYYNAFYLAGTIGPVFGGFVGSSSSFGFVLSISIVIIALAIILSFFIKMVTHKVVSEYDDNKNPIQPFATPTNTADLEI